MSNLTVATRYFKNGREFEGFTLVKELDQKIKNLIYGKLWENAGKPQLTRWGELAWENKPEAVAVKTVTDQDRQQAVIDVHTDLSKPLFLGKSLLDLDDEQQKLKEFSDTVRAKEDKYTQISRQEKNKGYCTYSFPFDKALVPLSGGRFINASYIFGKAQIHSQFPRSDITGEHWEMLYEQRVVVGVMLPQVGYEGRNDMERSFLYLPDEVEKTHTYGVVTVKLINKEHIKDHPLVRRTVSVQPKAKREYIMHHLQFIGWVDSQVCAVKDAIKACKILMSLQGKSKQPINFHCMAGVGRTGTMGTIYHLYQDAWEGNSVDVFNAVKSQRDPETGRTPHQVNDKQFCFIYECLEAVKQEGKKAREEMVKLFQKEDEFGALGYFEESPLRWRRKVYGKLYDVMGKPPKVPGNYGELAFHNKQGQRAPASKKAEAISSLRKDIDDEKSTDSFRK